MNNGTTACKWDVIIPFEPLWIEYKRIIKDRGCIALFGSEPFGSMLCQSNFNYFQYCWYWEKEQGTGVSTAKIKPMRNIEPIYIFYNSSCRYYPQKKKREKPIKIISSFKNQSESEAMIINSLKRYERVSDSVYPTSLIKFNRDRNNRLHPTQKPVQLLEYLIRTYTLEGETVLDNTMGSGSTGVACVNTSRNFIGIEKDDKYFEIAKNRIEKAQQDIKEKVASNVTQRESINAVMEG